MKSLFLLVVTLLALAGASLPATADDLAEAISGFAANSYVTSAGAVSAVAASGDERAATIIEALRDGRLLFTKPDRKVFIEDPSGTLTDAASGAPVIGAKPAGLKKVRVNNFVRGTINAALGTLSLHAKDPDRRLRAAETVFRSRDQSALPAVETALTKETNPDIKRALEQARAAIIIDDAGAPEADRMAAVAVLADRGGDQAMAVLRTLPADAPPALKTAAASAIAYVEREMEIWNALQNAWYGLSLGSVLLLAAMGLAITFGVMGVINMAHGEMVMLGAYTTFVVQQAIDSYLPGASEYALLFSVPAAFLVTGLFGIGIERGIVRFLYGRPLETLLATWGLSLVLQQLVRTVFGPTNQDVGTPSWMAGAFNVGHLVITNNRLWIIVFSLVVLGLMAGITRWTNFGLCMRAVTQNRRMAGSMGIRTGWIDALTFGLGSGTAGVAGVALSQIDNVSPNLGQSYIIDSFMVVVFGGVGNLWGTLVGAFSLGIVNKFLEPYAGAVLGKILVLVAIILFIQKRPRGMFALKGRAVEV
jgi:urea transport system permease protein